MAAPYSILGLQPPGRSRARSQRPVLYQWRHEVERRLHRFLANQRLDWAPCCQALAAWVLSPRSGRGPGVVLVDETSRQQRLKVMAVSLAARGRAIPLAWWCYPPTQWPMGQVQVSTTLRTWVAAGLADRRPVVGQADRGIGTSPALLRAIDRLGWYYLVRGTKPGLARRAGQCAVVGAGSGLCVDAQPRHPGGAHGAAPTGTHPGQTTALQPVPPSGCASGGDGCSWDAV